jgi:hypothetical protein
MSNCRQQPKIRKPSKAQQEAYRRLAARDGWKNVTTEDAQLLSTCSWLTVSQREALVAQALA